MQTLILAALAMTAGFLLSLQPAVNAHIARVSGAVSIAAFVSVAITQGLLSVPAFSAMRNANAGWIASLPWWRVLGGLAGAGIVLSGLMIGPRIGIVLLTASIVFGQAIGSLTVDNYGWFGQPVKTISLGRVSGIALVFCGLLVLLRSK